MCPTAHPSQTHLWSESRAFFCLLETVDFLLKYRVFLRMSVGKCVFLLKHGSFVLKSDEPLLHK